MPLYEYECDACRHRFEKIQKFSDPLEDTCPTCGGRVRKLVSSPAIQFKGSGWYVTDYAQRSGSADSKDGKKAESKSEAKSESKNGSDKAKTESKSTEKSTKS